MKLATKISWSIFLVAFLAASFGFVSFYILTRNILERKIIADIESIALSRAAHIETYLNMLKISVGQLSKSPTLENLLEMNISENFQQTKEYKAAKTRLRRTKEANPSVLEFLVIDKSGRVVISTDERSIGEDKSRDAIFLGAQEKVYIKDVYYLERLGKFLIAASAPLLDNETEEFRGVIAVRVMLTELNAICAERSGLGETGEIYLVNKYGFMITPSRFLKDTVLRQKVDTENVRQGRLHTGREHVLGLDKRVNIFPDYRGVPVLGTHTYIPEMKWIILAEINTSEAFAPLDVLFRIFVILLLAVSIISWLFGLLVSRTITRTLVRLHEGSEIIGSGNLDYKVGLDTNDEVGQLSRAFDKMTENLKTTTTSVEKLNKEIAARKQVEEDLAITLRSIGDALIATDLEGRVTRMNPVAEKLTGWPLAEAAGKPSGDVFHIINARTRQKVDDPVQLVLKKGQIIGLANHTMLIARDGTEYQIADSAAPIRDQKGQIKGAVLIFRDITTEYKTREALRESEIRYKALFTGAAEGIIIADLETKKFVFTNPAAQKLFGYLEDEFSRLGVQDIHPADSLDYVMSEFEAQARGEKTLAAALPCRRKDGTVFYADVSAASIVLDGRACNMGFFTDVTERKQTEDKIRRAKEDWENTFDSVPDLICLIDDKYAITRINRTMANVLGIKPEEAIGRKCYNCVHHTDQPPDFCPHVKLLNDGQEHRAEIREERLGKWLLVTVSPLRDKAGKIIGAIHVAHDITERKNAEKMLAEANEQLQNAFETANKLAVAAQAVSVAKGQFVANISHEIRTPLNGIIGICELLLGTRMSAEQKEYAQIINSSAETLLNIINATLDFSKIDAGKMELEHINFNLRTIFEDILSVLAVNAAQKKIELIDFLEPATPLDLNGDPGRLRQILFNLIGNAIKFTSEGEVLVTVAPVEEKEGKAYLRFAVRDTGIGIPPDKVDNLFEAFTQADESFTRKYGGTGLGLAISRGLVEQMGGKIGAESNPGKGSTFWFVIPFLRQDTVTTKSFEPEAYFGGQRILVVDDNETNRTILALPLQAWGAMVDTAESGKQALEKLCRANEEDQEPFMVVITDQRMPEMDGLALAQNIKARPEFQDLPLVLMTSMILPPEVYRQYRHLFASIILKPVRQAHLYYSLLKILSGEKIADRTDIEEPAVAETKFMTGLRILVAEDDMASRKVILGILEKLGHSAIAVANGKEVINSLENAGYDLVLMDIQMPEMDGFGATAVIRDPRSSVRDHNVPILALTAHAMESDREKCLAAGMNGYLTKPVSMKSVADAIAGIVSSDIAGAPRGEEAIQKVEPSVTFDSQALSDRLSGDKALIREIINIFLEETPKRMRELEKAIEKKQQENAGRLAHTVKGSAANAGSNKLYDVGLKIENACNAGDWPEAEALVPRLNRQFEMLEKAMREFLKKAEGA